jgi:hypothetical protein
MTGTDGGSMREEKRADQQAGQARLDRTYTGRRRKSGAKFGTISQALSRDSANSLRFGAVEFKWFSLMAVSAKSFRRPVLAALPDLTPIAKVGIPVRKRGEDPDGCKVASKRGLFRNL